uniref:Uncharacterized protein n=1 Tax=Parascaris equorum TaxID=6256 RepID=A0A914RGB0_PAREQ
MDTHRCGTHRSRIRRPSGWLPLHIVHHDEVDLESCWGGHSAIFVVLIMMHVIIGRACDAGLVSRLRTFT